jgi:hypothetical protein
MSLISESESQPIKGKQHNTQKKTKHKTDASLSDSKTKHKTDASLSD